MGYRVVCDVGPLSIAHPIKNEEISHVRGMEPTNHRFTTSEEPEFHASSKLAPHHTPPDSPTASAFYPMRQPKAEDSFVTARRRSTSAHVPMGPVQSPQHSRPLSQESDDTPIRLSRAEDSIVTAKRRDGSEQELIPLP